MQLQRIVKGMERSAHGDDDDDKAPDFSAAALYIPAMQTIFATVVASAVAVLANWVVPVGAISAVRTLAATVVAGLLIVRRPLRVGGAKGVTVVFAALRPCTAIYVGALVLEQLVHTCVSDEARYEHGFWRRVGYHGAMSVLTFGGLMRAVKPRSESDTPFWVSMGAIAAVAAFPPPALALAGPLCAPTSLFGAAERVVRAFAFSLLYSALVYAAAPISCTIGDTFVCVARSGAASAWVLGASPWTLPLAAVQFVIVVFIAFRNVPHAHEYADVASSYASDDVERGGECACGGGGGDGGDGDGGGGSRTRTFASSAKGARCSSSGSSGSRGSSSSPTRPKGPTFGFGPLRPPGGDAAGRGDGRDIVAVAAALTRKLEMETVKESAASLVAAAASATQPPPPPPPLPQFTMLSGVQGGRQSAAVRPATGFRFTQLNNGAADAGSCGAGAGAGAGAPDNAADGRFAAAVAAATASTATATAATTMVGAAMEASGLREAHADEELELREKLQSAAARLLD